MPDLNDLLRWSISNSAAKPNIPENQQLSLHFNPTTIPSSGSSTLHPSDSQYHEPTDDISPASTPGPATPVTGTSSLPGLPKRSGLNSEMLDLIMGKSDSLVMKEKMEIALDESVELDQRVEALDDLEMLIELIDNANNMAALKLWDPIISLLASKHSALVSHACWVIGTAVQNNLKAQAALYLYGALPKLLFLIYPSDPSSQPSSTTRARATYAFSSAVKTWPLASSALLANASQGYHVLRQGVSDPEPVIRRKMAFLVGTLVMQSGEKYEGDIPNEVRNLIEEKMEAGDEESLVDGLRREGIFSALAEALKTVDGEDFEFEENALRALVRAAEKGGLSQEEKAEVRSLWEKLGAVGQNERGMGGADGAEVSKILA